MAILVEGHFFYEYRCNKKKVRRHIFHPSNYRLKYIKIIFSYKTWLIWNYLKQKHWFPLKALLENYSVQSILIVLQNNYKLKDFLLLKDYRWLSIIEKKLVFKCIWSHLVSKCLYVIIVICEYIEWMFKSSLINSYRFKIEQPKWAI